MHQLNVNYISRCVRGRNTFWKLWSSHLSLDFTVYMFRKFFSSFNYTSEVFFNKITIKIRIMFVSAALLFMILLYYTRFTFPFLLILVFIKHSRHVTFLWLERIIIFADDSLYCHLKAIYFVLSLLEAFRIVHILLNILLQFWLWLHVFL